MKNSTTKQLLASCVAIFAITISQNANAQNANDKKAQELVSKMTREEKLQMLMGYFSTTAEWLKSTAPKNGMPNSAGYIEGISRLGIPAQSQTDAGVGVATQRSPNPRERSALPSGIALAATFNDEIAYKGGAMIGSEARLSGFNVMLAGGANLLREPRNGRNFEYTGEDPLLAGNIAGNAIKGIQSNHVVSTLKHYALNDQETNRFTIDVKIDEQAARQSDLLAFEIANEIGNPGSVMCSYNRVNGDYACENDWLLNQVLKKEWGYKGYVMSDWGATHSTIPAANRGLDQQSGYPFDKSPYFAGALDEAVNNNHVSEARLDDMVYRILYAMSENGLFEHPLNGDQSSKIDFAANGKITQEAAEEGIVLLKNERNLLPISKSAKSIVIIGGHADKGVLSGGGSSQVYPVGGMAVPNEGPNDFPGPMVYYPSSPMKELQKLTKAQITYYDGKDINKAAELAKKADVAIIFGNQWTGESVDVTNLNLQNNADALIDKVASNNSNTIVVLQTGGPVIMPWLNKAGAVLEAWYPGTSGGAAIARVLSGAVNPSGALPASFVQSIDQLPRPKLGGDEVGIAVNNPGQLKGRVSVDYNIEGAAVGYKWLDKTNQKPLFPFGYGLSYSNFEMSNLNVKANQAKVSVSFSVKNTSKIDGKAVAQIYAAPINGGWEAPKRLVGYKKILVNKSQKQNAMIEINPKTLAIYDTNLHKWVIKGGIYDFNLSKSSAQPVQTIRVKLDETILN